MSQWVRGLTYSLATRGLCAVLSPHSPRCLIWRGTSCTFVVFAQSAFPLCRPIRGFLSGWLRPRCDPPTHLQFGRTLTLRFVASWPKASWRLARGPVAAPIFQNVSLVRDDGCLNYNSLRDLSAATTVLWWVHEPLVNNALCCARGMVRPVSQWCSTTIKDAQYNGSLVVDTPSDEMNVFYDTGSSYLWVSNSACCDGSQVTISTTWERSGTYVANGNTFSSGTARVQCQVLLQNAVNSGCTNHRLHFRRDAYVSRLEISFSLEGIIWRNLQHGWCSTSIPFCGRSSYSSGKSGWCWRGARLRLLPWRSSQ